MTLVSRAFAAFLRLPPAKWHEVAVERGLSIPMPDGVRLVADRWYPASMGSDGLPIVLTRTPYGRGLSGQLGRLFAERGYQAVVVSCRATFGSGGEWRPLFNEQADGHAVLDWIAAQPWFGGSVGLMGGSYVGHTQWTVATDAPDFVKAIVPAITTANFRELIYPGETFALETTLNWAYGIDFQEDSLRTRIAAALRNNDRVREAAQIVPLADADACLLGHRVDFVQDWLERFDRDDPEWATLNFRRDFGRVPPASLVAGWYDIFAGPQVADFEALQTAGRPARITIGPWGHASPGGFAEHARASLQWMDAHLSSTPSPPKGDTVRLFVLGAKRWVTYPSWPPPATPTRWHLQPDGALSTSAPRASVPDRYRYDPTDPTPVRGGTTLLAKHAGPKDNRDVEARDDVLTYTSPVLADDLTIAGPVAARLYVRSSLRHTDFFVRLCDVAPDGKSTNLCDGIVRLSPGDVDEQPDGSFPVAVPMFPTANTFRAGHRIRVQVASGAHPIYARNPGSGEPLGKATTLIAADQEVLHDPEHPSSIELPVLAQPVRAERSRRFKLRSPGRASGGPS